MKSKLLPICAVVGSLQVAQAATLLVGFHDFSSTTSGSYHIDGSYTVNEGKLHLPQPATPGTPTTDVVIKGGVFNSLGTEGATNRAETIVTMIISNFVLPTSGTAILFEAGQNNNAGQWGIGVDSSGQFRGLWGNGVNGAALVSSSPVDWTKPVTVTVSSNNSGTKVYINGMLIQSAESPPKPSIGGLKFVGNLDSLYLGGNGNLTGTTLSSTSFDIDKLFVHGGKMTDEEINYFVHNTIPEPTSAALGVLGVASLMLRRKRS